MEHFSQFNKWHPYEHRLIHEGGAMGFEAISEKFKIDPRESVKQAVQVFLESMAKEVQKKKLEGEEKISFYKNSIENFGREKLEVLKSAFESKDVPEVFKNVFRFGTPEYQEIIESTKAKLEGLKEGIKDTVGDLVKSPFESSMRGAEWVADLVLSDKASGRLSKNQKRIIGSAVTLGTALLAGWVVGGVLRGRKAAKEERGGILKKLFWGTLIGAGAITGITYVGDWMIKKYMGDVVIAAGRKAEEEARKLLDKAGEKFDERVSEVGEDIAGIKEELQPGVKYGILEEEYNRAVAAYGDRKEGAVDEIRAIFGPANSEGCELFLAEMREERPKPIKINDISYMPAEDAFRRYEAGMQEGFNAIEKWMDSNKTLVLVGSVLAVRFGLLRAIFRGASSLGAKSLAAGNMLRRWAQENPLGALLVMSGTAAGAFAAYKTMKGIRIPMNLRELYKACSAKAELIIGKGAEIGAEELKVLHECGEKVGEVTKNIAEWVDEHFGTLARDAIKQAPKAFALTPRESIVDMHMSCTNKLRNQIEGKMLFYKQYPQKEVLIQPCEKALLKLEEFSDKNIIYREGEEQSSGDVQSELQELTSVLSTINITLIEKEGYVRWKDEESGEEFDLCVDPANDDIGDVHERSSVLYYGSIPFELVSISALRKLREMQQEHLEGWIGGWPAIVCENVVHCINPSGAWDYFTVPADIFHAALSESEEDMKRGSGYVSFGEAMAATAVFSVSATLVSKIKRFAVGGGAMRFRRSRGVFLRYIPVASQADMAARLWGVPSELRTLSRLWNKYDFQSARRAMTVAGKANIFPGWIVTIEHTTNPDDLIRLSRFYNVGGNLGSTVAELKAALETGNKGKIKKAMKKLRRALRETVIRRMERVKTFSPWRGGQKIFEEVLKDAETIYYQIAGTVKKTSSSSGSSSGGSSGGSSGSSSGGSSGGSSGSTSESSRSSSSGTGALDDAAEAAPASAAADNLDDIRRALPEETVAKLDDILRIKPEHTQFFASSLSPRFAGAREINLIDDVANALDEGFDIIGFAKSGDVSYLASDPERAANIILDFKTGPLRKFCMRQMLIGENAEDLLLTFHDRGFGPVAGEIETIVNTTDGVDDSVKKSAKDVLAHVRETDARGKHAQDVLERFVGRTTSLSQDQIKAIQKAHEVPSTLEPGKTGYSGSKFTLSDIKKKIKILREAGFEKEEWRILLREGICGDDLAELARRASVLDEVARLIEGAGENVDDAARTTNRSIRARSLIELFDGDSKKAAELILEPLQGSPHFDECAKVAEKALKSGDAAKAQRALEYALHLPDDVDDLVKSEAMIEKIASSVDNADELHDLAITVSHPKFKVGGSVDECFKAANKFKAKQAIKGARIFAGALLPVDLLSVGFDTYMITQELESVSEKRKALVESLLSAGFEGSPGGEEFTKHGITVNIAEIHDYDGVVGWSSKLGLDLAAGGVTIAIIAGSTSATGIGLPVAAVVIASHVAIDQFSAAIKQHGRRQVLESLPSWVVAEIGSIPLVAQSEYDILQEHIGTMRSDIMPTSWTDAALMANAYGGVKQAIKISKYVWNKNEYDAKKMETRKKACHALCYRIMRQQHPDLYMELPGAEGGAIKFLDPNGDFLKKPGGDFETIVKPHMVLQLLGNSVHQFRGNRVSLEDLKDLDITKSNEWLFGWNIVSDDVLERSTRDAMLFYVQHVRQEKYRGKINQIKGEAAKLRDKYFVCDPGRGNEWYEQYVAMQVAAYNESVDENKSQNYVFNKHPSEFGLDEGTEARRRLSDWYSKIESGKADESFMYSLSDALDEDITRHHDPIVESELKAYDKNNSSLPFTFAGMEKRVREEGRNAVVNELKNYCAPLKEISAFVYSGMYKEQPVMSDEMLVKMASEMDSHIDDYLAFQPHYDFYQKYLVEWLFEPYPELPYKDDSDIVSLLKDWSEDPNRPVLVDEGGFKAWQQHVEARRKQPEGIPTNFSLSAQDMYGNKVLPKLSQLKIPGFDESRDRGVLLYSYNGYKYLMQSRIAERMSRKERGDFGFEFLDSASDVYLSPEAYGGSKVMTAGKPQEAKFKIDGKDVPITVMAAYSQALSNSIALCPEELEGFLLSMGAGQELSKRTGVLKLQDKYTPLRRKLLENRIFIVHDIQSEQSGLDVEFE